MTHGRIADHVRRNVVGYIALFLFAAMGTAQALPGQDTVGSRDIKDGHVRAQDLASDSVSGRHVVRNSLTGSDIDESKLNLGEGLTGPEGPQGPEGPRGPEGATGPPGATGPAGSPDTPQQVLDKLSGVDGTGSGLDADRLDGLSSSDFASADQVHAVHGQYSDDPSPDDVPAPESFLMASSGGQIEVEVTCWESFDDGGGPPFEDMMVVEATGPANMEVNGVDGDGIAIDEVGASVTLIDFAVDTLAPNQNIGRYASFVAMTQDDMLSGQIAARVNSSGASCDAWATGIG